MITGEVEAVDRKQKIRDRYKGVDISELEVIPAKIIEDLETSSVIRRVAAYIRVSTDNLIQHFFSLFPLGLLFLISLLPALMFLYFSVRFKVFRPLSGL